MTGPARKSTTADDEARWAEAQSILDRTPTVSAEARLRRSQRNRWLLVAAFVLVGLAVAVLLALFVFDDGTGDESGDVPTWRAVVGFSLSGLGLLFMVVALVVQFRGLRRVRAWGSPLHVLTFRQRRELLRQVRGRGPHVPERVPLARHLAELLGAQRLALPVMAGLLLNLVGLWIVDRATYRLIFIGVFVVLITAISFRGESRRAGRYLAEHPLPDA